jgi:endo-1,4-beta-mannosidase
MSIEWIVGIFITLITAGIGAYVKMQTDFAEIKKDIEMDGKLTASKFAMIDAKIDSTEKKFIESIDNLEKTLSSFEKVLEKMDKNQAELAKTIVAIQIKLG